MAGVPVMTDWGYFPEAMPCFPGELTTQFLRATGLPGILGNRHASGTSIIEDLGQEHITSGKPICYTSADSVFQIAAHEEHFGLERLYDICEIARKLVDDWHIARVIARPFVGQFGTFVRTANRRDYTTPPPQWTLLDKLKIAGGEVIGIGKISDIYAGCGISRNIKADGNMALFDATLRAMDEAGDQSIVFANFVDFDMLFGHRRDVAGYANALEAFDRRLPELIKKLRAGDLVFATADHGCDPTFPGHDHTRENVPVLAFGPEVLAAPLGARQSFADIGQTVAAHLNLEPLESGISFLSALHH
jgi:phosphopentomutase